MFTVSNKRPSDYMHLEFSCYKLLLQTMLTSIPVTSTMIGQWVYRKPKWRLLNFCTGSFIDKQTASEYFCSNWMLWRMITNKLWSSISRYLLYSCLSHLCSEWNRNTSKAAESKQYVQICCRWWYSQAQLCSWTVIEPGGSCSPQNLF